MGRKRRSKGRERVEVDGEGFGGGLSDQLKALGLVAPDAQPEASAPLSAEGAAPDPADLTATRPVVRMERKGRGGKTVTVVERLEPLEPSALEAVAKGLRKALGCGAGVEGAILVVQGEQVERVKAWLRAEGARL